MNERYEMWASATVSKANFYISPSILWRSQTSNGDSAGPIMQPLLHESTDYSSKALDGMFTDRDASGIVSILNSNSRRSTASIRSSDSAAHFASIDDVACSSRLSQRISINLARSVELSRIISALIDVRLMRRWISERTFVNHLCCIYHRLVMSCTPAFKPVCEFLDTARRVVVVLQSAHV